MFYETATEILILEIVKVVHKAKPSDVVFPLEKRVFQHFNTFHGVCAITPYLLLNFNQMINKVLI